METRRSEMGRGINFLECLVREMTLCILSLLDDPADIVRVAAVSRSWRHFVISNGVSKQVCLRKAPTLTNVTSMVEKRDEALITYSNTTSWDALKKDHEIFTYFLHAITHSMISPMECIERVIGASSTNKHPEENVINVLLESKPYIWGRSYWSSTGQSDPSVPESIVLKLYSNVCIVSEIDIRPCEAYWEDGRPVYSAKSVRFRMGHAKSSVGFQRDVKGLPMQNLEDKYVWTYTSPEFPMTQESYSQPFKLPEPVVCLGAFLQIELLGRTQRNEADGLYYLRMSRVHVLGQPLPPEFIIDLLS